MMEITKYYRMTVKYKPQHELMSGSYTVTHEYDDYVTNFESRSLANEIAEQFREDELFVESVTIEERVW